MRAFLVLLLTAAPAAAEFVVVNRCPPAFTVVNKCAAPGRCVCSGGACDLCPDCKCRPAPAPVPAPPAAQPVARSFVDAATGCTYTETAPGSGRYVLTACPARR